MKKYIGIVTGSRADFGLLTPVIDILKNDSQFDVTVFVTGMHLSPKFGDTYKVVEKEFGPTVHIKSMSAENDARAIGESIGRGTIGFSRAFSEHALDLVLLLGDRYEIFAAAQAALVAQIPVAHLCGGDVTEGAFDEAIRHSITKMSHLHFVTNNEAEHRLRQLGEDPKYIYNFGSPAIDLILRTPLMNRDELEQSLGFELREKNLIVTFHPQTLSETSPSNQVNELLKALDAFKENLGIIITGANADTQGNEINQVLQSYAENNSSVHFSISLGQKRYWSALSLVDTIVGNSSSALYEGPTFKKPAVNIGARQKGRLIPSSVLSCDNSSEEIISTIERALKLDCSNVTNPYGTGNCCERIANELRKFTSFKPLVRKHFFDFGDRCD